MHLFINGQPRETPALGRVADLARWLELPPFGSAVELNGRVVRRPDYGDTPLEDGDHVEVVRLVGGG
jgi:sulfur carrier protein